MRATAAIASISVMVPPGLAIELDEDRLGVRRHRALEASDVVGVGPDHIPSKTLEGVAELVDRAAIELARRDEFVTGVEQHLESHNLCRVAGGYRQCRGAAFESCDTLLQHRLRRVADPGIDIAERLQAEQRSGVIGIVEHEGRGLVDRRCPRAGSRIGLRARVHGKGGKARRTIGHMCSLFRLFRRHADVGCVCRQGRVAAGGLLGIVLPSSALSAQELS